MAGVRETPFQKSTCRFGHCPFNFTLASVHLSSFTPAISLSFQFAPANVYSKVSPSTALSHNTNLKSLSIQFPSSNQLCTASVYCDKLSTTRYLGSLLDKMVKLGTCRHSVLGVQPMEFPLHDSRKWNDSYKIVVFNYLCNSLHVLYTALVSTGWLVQRQKKTPFGFGFGFSMPGMRRKFTKKQLQPWHTVFNNTFSA